MKILICDEDEDYMEELVKDLRALPCEEDLYFESFDNIKSAQYRLRFDDFDMAFIDSEVDGESTIELGRKIKEKCPECFLFFNSDTYNHIHDMFTVHAFQFVIKKNLRLLSENFERAMEVRRQNNLQLPFMTLELERHVFIPSEIIYVETGKIPSKIVTIHRSYYGEFENMVSLKKKLADYHFFQVHQSFLVNLHHVACMHRGEMVMDNGDAVPTSTYNKVFVEEAVQRYMNSY